MSKLNRFCQPAIPPCRPPPHHPSSACLQRVSAAADEPVCCLLSHRLRHLLLMVAAATAMPLFPAQAAPQDSLELWQYCTGLPLADAAHGARHKLATFLTTPSYSQQSLIACPLGASAPPRLSIKKRTRRPPPPRLCGDISPARPPAARPPTRPPARLAARPPAGPPAREGVPCLRASNQLHNSPWLGGIERQMRNPTFAQLWRY